MNHTCICCIGSGCSQIVHAFGRTKAFLQSLDNIKIYRERGIGGGTKEYLYEDGNNAANVAETLLHQGFNYLGITGENIKPVGRQDCCFLCRFRSAFFKAVMPQYLLYVDRDTIAKASGATPVNTDTTTVVTLRRIRLFTMHLSYGRVLVNLNDSVRKYNGTSINMLENAVKLYHFENYTSRIRSCHPHQHRCQRMIQVHSVS